jgi:hypothetical protein
VLRVARTLADLAGAERLSAAHVARGGAVSGCGGGLVIGPGGPGAGLWVVGLPLGRVRPLAALPEAVGASP